MISNQKKSWHLCTVNIVGPMCVIIQGDNYCTSGKKLRGLAVLRVQYGTYLDRMLNRGVGYTQDELILLKDAELAAPMNMILV